MAPSKKKHPKPTSTTSSSPPNPPPRPNWPPLSPLLPPSSLSLTPHPLHPTQIITIPNFWTPTLCKTYTSFLSNLPLTTTPGKPKRGDAVRVNDRYQIDDAEFAERLWVGTGLRELVLGLGGEEERGGDDDGEGLDEAVGKEVWGGDVVGLNPNIRIYRYTPGQFFDQHYDDSNSVTIPGTPPISARTTWTLLLYLSSPATGCIGGETVFYPEPEQTGGKKKKSKEPPPEPVVCELEVGMALLHRHGRECMLHEGREVKAGEKWVIRSDVCVRR